ncbi:hypothetical protein COO60DRAFT_1510814, partial [Scenedesmus sp. NREL 46B-D3]
FDVGRPAQHIAVMCRPASTALTVGIDRLNGMPVHVLAVWRRFCALPRYQADAAMKVVPAQHCNSSSSSSSTSSSSRDALWPACFTSPGGRQHFHLISCLRCLLLSICPHCMHASMPCTVRVGSHQQPQISVAAAELLTCTSMLACLFLHLQVPVGWSAAVEVLPCAVRTKESTATPAWTCRAALQCEFEHILVRQHALEVVLRAATAAAPLSGFLACCTLLEA